MKKCLVRLALCNRRLLRYYLLKERRHDGAASYGVCVEYGAEQRQIRNITGLRERIRGLLVRLSSGCVTPVALGDVVEDWLLE